MGLVVAQRCARLASCVGELARQPKCRIAQAGLKFVRWLLMWLDGCVDARRLTVLTVAYGRGLDGKDKYGSDGCFDSYYSVYLVCEWC
jgi:hypothetical protein